MSTATLVLGRPFAIAEGQRLDFGGLTYDQYLLLADALPECRGIKTIYADGELTFMTLSRRHDCIVEAIGDIVKAVAIILRLGIAMSGRATFRKEEAGGVEGDLTYYFGEHARIMRGDVEIDLTIQPPPDLAIEVEVTHPADRAMKVWGRLGVPEVWRFREATWSLSFWVRQEDGTYARSDQSLALPMLSAGDVEEQVRRFDDLPFEEWYFQLYDWVRDVLVPRHANGGR